MSVRKKSGRAKRHMKGKSAAKSVSKVSPARRRAGDPLPDLHSILGRLHDALALVTVAHVAVMESDVPDQLVGQASSVLRQGITELNAVYNELDAAGCQLRRAAS